MRSLQPVNYRMTLPAGIIAGAASILVVVSAMSTGRAERDSNAIRPFRVNIGQPDLDELRRRVLATRWPDKETVPDQSQGSSCRLNSFGGAAYNAKAERIISSRPHFLHVRSRHPNALLIAFANRVSSATLSNHRSLVRIFISELSVTWTGQRFAISSSRVR